MTSTNSFAEHVEGLQSRFSSSWCDKVSFEKEVHASAPPQLMRAHRSDPVSAARPWASTRNIFSASMPAKHAQAQMMVVKHAATFHSSRRMNALVPDWNKWFKECAHNRRFREYMCTRQERLRGEGEVPHVEPQRLARRLPGRRQIGAHGTRRKSGRAREEMYRHMGVEFHATGSRAGKHGGRAWEEGG